MYLFVLKGRRIRDHLHKHTYGWNRQVQERITTRGLIQDENLRKKAYPFPLHPIQQQLYRCGYTNSRWQPEGVGQFLHGFIIQMENESEAIWLKMGQDKILTGLRISEIYKFKDFTYLEKQEKKLNGLQHELFLMDRLVGMKEDAERINKEAEGVYVELLNPHIKDAIKIVSEADFTREPLEKQKKQIKGNIKRHITKNLVKTYE